MQSSDRSLWSRCPSYRSRLPAYIEGELDAEASRRVQEHLATCASCSGEAAAYRASLGALHRVSAPPAHGDLYAGFAAKLAATNLPAVSQAAPVDWWRRTSVRWSAGIGGALAVAGAGAAIGPRLLAPSPRPAAPVASTVPVAVSELPVPLPVHRAAAAQAPTPAVTPFHYVPESTPGLDLPPSAAIGPSGSTAYVAAAPEARLRHAHDSTGAPAVSQSSDSEATPGDFLHVSASKGPSAAEQVIAVSHPNDAHEETVAAARPDHAASHQPTQPTAHVAAEPIRPDADSIAPVAAPIPKAVRPEVLVPMASRRVDVNGHVADVQTAVGLDRAGRPVMVNVNIGTSRTPKIEKVPTRYLGGGHK